MNKALRILSGSVWMAILTGLVLVIIVLLNWLPWLVQQHTAQQYNDIDAAKKAAGIENIMIPVYIPETVSWPPALLVSQKKPFNAVVMEFVNTKTRETELFIIQSSSEEAEKRLQKIDFIEIKEETEYKLKGRKATLQVGDCKGASECSKIIWQENNIYCSVFLMSSSFKLIRVAESMIR